MTKVLVADDSETILLLMRTRLELAGYEVETAADGQEVTERIARRRRRRPRPAPARRDDAAQVRASTPCASCAPPGVETPALIVSAHQDPSDADAPTDLEISGYVTKPIDFDRLLGRDRRR